MANVTTETRKDEGIVTEVRRRYAEIAVKGSSCCLPAPTAAAGCCGGATSISEGAGYRAGPRVGSRPRRVPRGQAGGAHGPSDRHRHDPGDARAGARHGGEGG